MRFNTSRKRIHNSLKPFLNVFFLISEALPLRPPDPSGFVKSAIFLVEARVVCVEEDCFLKFTLACGTSLSLLLVLLPLVQLENGLEPPAAEQQRGFDHHHRRLKKEKRATVINHTPSSAGLFCWFPMGQNSQTFDCLGTTYRVVVVVMVKLLLYKTNNAEIGLTFLGRSCSTCQELYFQLLFLNDFGR